MQKNSVILLFLFTVFLSCKSEKSTQSRILADFVRDGSKSILPDFSYAGYAYGEKVIPLIEGPIFNVIDYGAKPNDGIDDSKCIQDAVNAAGIAGGGVVFFPSGRFLVNMDTAKLDIIKINYSNIVMRGSGSGENGTTIFSGSQTTQAEEASPWLSPFVFHTGLNLQSTSEFFQIDDYEKFSSIKQDVSKGDKVIKLENTGGLKAGDVLVIAMRNTTDDGNLMKHIMRPLTFDPLQTSYLNAGKDRQPSFQYFMEIAAVLSDSEIQMTQPMRCDILTQFESFVVKVPMLKNIGIENFRFECAYKGGYKHHLTREHDYGWGAVCLQRVSHGWVRNLDIHNYVQNTHLINSRNVTIQNITMSGLDGHYGPKMYHSSDNLVCDINVEAKYTHGPGLEGCSFGNVYRKINLVYPSPVDLHGLAGREFCPPMYNLYEEISNLTRVAGGGSPANIPHAGEYNTLWGLEMTGFDDDGFNELFYSWTWRDPERFKNEFHIDCHKQYLRSIVVGVHHPDKKLSIEKMATDRDDEWIYVEGLNENLSLSSLYKTQLNLRLKKQVMAVTNNPG